MRRRFLLLIFIATGLISCTGTQSSQDQAPENRCEPIGKLLQSHQTGFADIRGRRNSYNRIDIWSTSFQLVGSGCEIWGWQEGKFNYVCNYVAPNEESARSIFKRAADTIGACATEGWEREDQSTQEGIGQQSVWRRPGLNAVVDLKLVQTRGIGKPRWAIYLLIGDFNSQL
jgi:hypothetical protein